jgi:hypothetical protein
MITVLVVAAETDEAARHLFTSIQQIVLTMLRGDMAGPLPPPVHDLSAIATASCVCRVCQCEPSENSKANRIETGERSGGIGEICSVEVDEK